jgi:hypothetical protein
MANWKYLTDDEKKKHELYKKNTAFSFFMIYLAFQCFLSLGSGMGAYAEYGAYLRDYSYDSQASAPLSFLIISLIPSIFIFLALILFKVYGKSKKTVNLFIIFLITFPFIALISNTILMFKYGLDANAMFPKTFALFLLFILFGIIFYLYSKISKPFNLQYLNRIKS